MPTVGQLIVDIAANSSALKTGLDAARSEIRSFKDATGAALDGMKKNVQGLVAGYFSLQTVRTVFAGVVRATIEGEQATAKLNAVLKATGNAAGLTARQIADMSDELAQSSLFDDDGIRDAAAQLATFRNISGDTFRETMQAAVDLSTVMDQDLQSSVVQLGKALNDPLKGISALTKVGVSFSAVQKEQIRQFVEAGDVMGAQRVILQELAGEFGGAGAASTQGLAGSIHLAEMAYDDFLESLGKTPQFKSLVTDTLQGWADIFKAVQLDAESRNAPTFQLSDQIRAFKREQVAIEQFVAERGEDPASAGLVDLAAKRWDELAVMIAVAQVELKHFMETATGGAGGPGGGIDVLSEEFTRQGKALADAVKVANQRRPDPFLGVDLEQFSPSVVAQRDMAKLRKNLFGDGMTPEQRAIFRQHEMATAAATANVQTDEAAKLWEQTWENAVRGVQEDFTQFFERLGDDGFELVSILTDIAAAIRSVLAQSASQSLMDLIGPAILSGISGGAGAGAGAGGGGSSKITGFVKHAGGTVGDGGPVRYVAPELFFNAPRYHTGGIVGLRPGERPIIAEDGERILARGESAGGSVVHVHMATHLNSQSLDPRSHAELLYGQADTIAGIIAQKVQDSPGFARLLRGAA